MPRITQIIETLEAEKAELEKRLEWIEVQLVTFREHAAEHPEAPPAPGAGTGAPPKPAPRAKRLDKAARARSRRATAKTLKRDLESEILAHLAKHPKSTAGDVAKGLDANRNSVAAKLNQLMKAGQLVKADRGYSLTSGDRA
jgi:predicted metal-dependent hydrolase